MHEFSLVHSLLQQVGDLLIEHGGVRVETIRVEMGPLSGVERKLLELAFEQEVDESTCRGAQLIVEEVPLTAVCQECAVEFEMSNFDFLCPVCSSRQIRIAGGDDFKLLDVEIEVTEQSKPEFERCVT